MPVSDYQGASRGGRTGCPRLVRACLILGVALAGCCTRRACPPTVSPSEAASLDRATVARLVETASRVERAVIVEAERIGTQSPKPGGAHLLHLLSTYAAFASDTSVVSDRDGGRVTRSTFHEALLSGADDEVSVTLPPSRLLEGDVRSAPADRAQAELLYELGAKRDVRVRLGVDLARTDGTWRIEALHLPRHGAVFKPVGAWAWAFEGPR